MKSKIIYSLMLAAGLMLAGAPANSIAAKTTKKTATKAAITYTCPMHPEVIKAKPGQCPKCGMTLVVKKMPAQRKS